MDEEIDLSTGSSSTEWKVWGKKIPKSEVVYFCQVFILFVVIISAILNLSLQAHPEKREMWITLLGYAVGSILPQPKIKRLQHPMFRPLIHQRSSPP